MKTSENLNETAGVKTRWKSPYMRQFYASITALIPVMCVGNIIGYSSTLLQQLAEPGSFIALNSTLTSWIASIAVLPLAPMAFVSGYSMERFGRKKTHYVTCAFFTIGWLIIAFSYSLESLLIGRFFNGIGMGFQGPLTSVHIAEVTSPSIRHVYLSCIATLLAVGIILIHMAGEFIHWKMIALICSMFSFVSALMMIQMPDTPNWYVIRGKIEESEKSFRFYRGLDENASKELEKMIRNNPVEVICKDSTVVPENSGTYRKVRMTLSKMRRREFLRPLGVMSLLFVMSQLSGNNVVSFYSVQIINEIMARNINPYVVLLSMDTLRLLASISSSVLLKWFRKRTILLVSGLSSAASLICLALFLCLREYGHISNSYYWAPPLFLAAYMFSLPLGVTPLPWMLLGELFPADLKGIGGSISTCVTCTMLFVVTKTAPYMFDVWGTPLTFGFYGITVLVLTVIVVILLPETHGKTLQEIEDQFKRKQCEADDEIFKEQNKFNT